MKNLLKCRYLIKVAVIIVVMAFMASQVTDTYARGSKHRSWSDDDSSSDDSSDDDNTTGGGETGGSVNGDAECPTCCDA